MRSTLTISLPADIRKELDRVVREEGIPRSAVVRQSLKHYLWSRRFHALRRRMMAKLKRPYTDQDIFDMVS